MVRIAVVNDDTTFLSLVEELLADNNWEAYTLKESKTAAEVNVSALGCPK